MKRTDTGRTLRLGLMALMLALGGVALAGRKADMRVDYVLRHLGVKTETQARLKPMLVSYLADKKAASRRYDALKDKYQGAIKAGTLTERQAEDLLAAKWAAAAEELSVKRQYAQRFRTVLSARKTYQCFDLLNDKKSKIERTTRQ